jgi:hypothetical protein
MRGREIRRGSVGREGGRECGYVECGSSMGFGRIEDWKWGRRHKETTSVC